MITKLLKSVFLDMPTFFVVWAVTILVNQIFLFGACFAPYCLVAALPHTFVIAALIKYFYSEANPITKGKPPARPGRSALNALEGLNPSPRDSNALLKHNTENQSQRVFCPLCDSEMTLRKAKRGNYAGQLFWGCNRFPECKGIINLQIPEQANPRNP